MSQRRRNQPAKALTSWQKREALLEGARCLKSFITVYAQESDPINRKRERDARRYEQVLRRLAAAC